MKNNKSNKNVFTININIIGIIIPMIVIFKYINIEETVSVINNVINNLDTLSTLLSIIKLILTIFQFLSGL